MDAVFRPDTSFSPPTFDDLSMEGSVENPIVLDEEEDKENAVPAPSTPETVRTTEPPGCREVALLEHEWKMYRIIFLEFCFNRYYGVCGLIKILINVFHFIITFFKNYSDTCETKAVVVSISLILLVAAGLCIYQAQTENKVGHHSEIKFKVLAKTSTRSVV